MGASSSHVRVVGDEEERERASDHGLTERAEKRSEGREEKEEGEGASKASERAEKKERKSFSRVLVEASDPRPAN